jgi:uncharacterized membrane protein
MATITVLKFETPQGAGEMLDLLKSLTKQRLITVRDAATVVWEKGKKKPKTKQLVGLAGLGALDGAFWGMLFGLIFFVPFFGMAIGAAMGALAGKFSDYGIDDDFIKSVRDKVTEGTSALFLMTSDAVMDKVVAAVKEAGPKFELVTSNLSNEQEEELHAAFGEE